MKIKDIITEAEDSSAPASVNKARNFANDIGSAISAGRSGSYAVQSPTDISIPKARISTTINSKGDEWEMTNRGWYNNTTNRFANSAYSGALDKRAEKEAEQGNTIPDTTPVNTNNPSPIDKPSTTNVNKPTDSEKPATQAPSGKEQIVGRIPVPAGHVLKMVMPSERGPIDYFKYPNGKWFVQWTSGSSLQLLTDPETLENLNYLLPSQATSIKVSAIAEPKKTKGRRQ